eukprot:g3652.t1
MNKDSLGRSQIWKHEGGDSTSSSRLSKTLEPPLTGPPSTFLPLMSGGSTTTNSESLEKTSAASSALPQSLISNTDTELSMKNDAFLDPDDERIHQITKAANPVDVAREVLTPTQRKELLYAFAPYVMTSMSYDDFAQQLVAGCPSIKGDHVVRLIQIFDQDLQGKINISTLIKICQGNYTNLTNTPESFPYSPLVKKEPKKEPED